MNHSNKTTETITVTTTITAIKTVEESSNYSPQPEPAQSSSLHPILIAIGLSIMDAIIGEIITVIRVPLGF